MDRWLGISGMRCQTRSGKMKEKPTWSDSAVIVKKKKKKVRMGTCRY